ncbi:MAG: hypothetical protein U0Q55_21395 [Vicinamibacterales bacterium]
MSRLAPDAASPVALAVPQLTRTVWVHDFDDRYGHGAYATLVEQLSNQRASYADIAAVFGVSRERVRQWHHALFPSAPRGRDRRRTRGVYNQKRRLLQDPLFRAFVRAARGRVAPAAIAPVRGRDGFRKRMVEVDGQSVVLRRASRARLGQGSSARPVYSLSGSRGSAALVFFQLGAEDFLLVPRAILPAGGTTYTDSGGSPYSVYRNSFAALAHEVPARGAHVTYDVPVRAHDSPASA